MSEPATMSKNNAANGANGDTTAYGQNTVHSLLAAQQKEASADKLSPINDHVLKTFRLVIADLCQQFAGGHPGGAMGAAAIGLALWRYVMRYAPHSPDWFNRDRFVLSNGHTCLLQYTYLHLVGYKQMNLEMLKTYHSARFDGICPGHPEKEHEGIEVTTGPLGQGIANAVGLAAAARHLGATFNREGFEVVNPHIWCMVGDACLQEGVALEAISLAGHWKLGNLTVMYDNNQVTCDGSVDIVNTEDVNAKMAACGWEILSVDEGCFNVGGIVDALEKSKLNKDQPTFINIKTIIGVGSAVAGDAVAHGVALQVDDVAQMKKAYGFDPEESFAISDDVRSFFSKVPPRGEAQVQAWNELLSSYTKTHPDLARTFKARMNGELAISSDSPSDSNSGRNWSSLVPPPSALSKDKTSTRASTGHILSPVAAACPTLMLGTADLTPSVHMSFHGGSPFNPPSLHPLSGAVGSYSGRYIHYGIREHAMAAIANGLAAFHPGTIVPVTSSFQMFYLYAAPAVRMGALQNLQVLHAATHDSIGMGEDGPTHQPLELAALFRAMPNFLFFRPGDAEETAGAWQHALKHQTGPSMVSTSRHKVKQQTTTRREGVAKGAYVLEEVEEEEGEADVTILGVGAELEIAVTTASTLREKYGRKVRVVSAPCMRLFDEQSRDYRRTVLRRFGGASKKARSGGTQETNGNFNGAPGRDMNRPAAMVDGGAAHKSRIPACVVEPYTGSAWAAYADAGVVMSTQRFGHSLPGSGVYEYFSFTPEKVALRVENYLKGLDSGEYILGEWAEI